MKRFGPLDRGNVAEITATPRDADNNPVTPASVTAYIEYQASNGRPKTTQSMTLSGGIWSTSWDTSTIDIVPGDVYVSVRAVNPPSADDFTFPVQANPANPNP